MCEREPHTVEDHYAVHLAVKKDETIFGHLPYHKFVHMRGMIECTVTGARNCLADLAQGGLEIIFQSFTKGDTEAKILWKNR